MDEKAKQAAAKSRIPVVGSRVKNRNSLFMLDLCTIFFQHPGIRNSQVLFGKFSHKPILYIALKVYLAGPALIAYYYNILLMFFTSVVKTWLYRSMHALEHS